MGESVHERRHRERMDNPEYRKAYGAARKELRDSVAHEWCDCRKPEDCTYSANCVCALGEAGANS